ncbi:hypothetical protein DOTSEDRAFT_80148 [Dothistroma septosporum NZE10]|uniref:Uncharacterized protein n=1 Tax=Dothistroma septosporum (strain NZE10 / CBS 128990) TaxID=675120 RepID=N1PM16_DOTSN|nr:hypothetical protein DOTSEDRAFT_80148 [Dothistroma septosporum NZE10]
MLVRFAAAFLATAWNVAHLPIMLPSKTTRHSQEGDAHIALRRSILLQLLLSLLLGQGTFPVPRSSIGRCPFLQVHMRRRDRVNELPPSPRAYERLIVPPSTVRDQDAYTAKAASANPTNSKFGTCGFSFSTHIACAQHQCGHGCDTDHDQQRQRSARYKRSTRQGAWSVSNPDGPPPLTPSASYRRQAFQFSGLVDGGSISPSLVLSLTLAITTSPPLKSSSSLRPSSTPQAALSRSVASHLIGYVCTHIDTLPKSMSIPMPMPLSLSSARRTARPLALAGLPSHSTTKQTVGGTRQPEPSSTFQTTTSMAAFAEVSSASTQGSSLAPANEDVTPTAQHTFVDNMDFITEAQEVDGMHHDSRRLWCLLTHLDMNNPGSSHEIKDRNEHDAAQRSSSSSCCVNPLGIIRRPDARRSALLLLSSLLYGASTAQVKSVEKLEYWERTSEDSMVAITKLHVNQLSLVALTAVLQQLLRKESGREFCSGVGSSVVRQAAGGVGSFDYGRTEIRLVDVSTWSLPFDGALARDAQQAAGASRIELAAPTLIELQEHAARQAQQ